MPSIALTGSWFKQIFKREGTKILKEALFIRICFSGLGL